METLVIHTIGAPRETGAYQSHGERVAREHHHPVGIVANEFRKASADFDRGVPVVGESQDPARVLAPRAYKIGDTMHQHPCLAGAGTGEHQHARLLPIVRHDAALNGISQAFDNGSPRLRRGLPTRFPCSLSGSQRRIKSSRSKHEIVHSQTQGISHRPKSLAARIPP